MSTSLNVVSIAAVFCDSFNRVAIVFLIFDIFTTSSLSFKDVEAADGLFIKLITSSFVKRPSDLEEEIFSAFKLFSVTSFCTAGDNFVVSCFTEGVASFSTLGFSFGGSFVSTFSGATVPFVDFLSPKSARTPPIFTSAPSSTLISDIEPALGAGTSTVILSVSISTNGSSASNESPTFFNHLETVASVIDSPSVGTINSIIF